MHRTLLAVAVGFATTVTAFGCGSSSDPPNPDPSGSASASTGSSAVTTPTDGAGLYRTKCAGCHGTGGEGNLGPALVGIAERLSRADQIAVVANGRGTMLAFSPGLSDAQIAAVVDHTRTGLPARP